MAMGAAALNDAAAWCLLVLAISLGEQTHQIITDIIILDCIFYYQLGGISSPIIDIGIE